MRTNNIISIFALILIIVGGLFGGIYIKRNFLTKKDIDQEQIKLITNYEELNANDKNIVESSIELLMKTNFYQFLGKSVEKINDLPNEDKLWLLYVTMPTQIDKLTSEELIEKERELFGSSYNITFEDIYAPQNKEEPLFTFNEITKKYENINLITTDIYEIVDMNFISFLEEEQNYKIIYKPLFYENVLGCNSKIDFFDVKGNIVYTKNAKNEEEPICYLLDIEKEELNQIYEEKKSVLSNIEFTFTKENDRLIVVGFKIVNN